MLIEVSALEGAYRFHLSEEKGFLPQFRPVTTLPPAFQELELVVRELPERLAGQEPDRDRVAVLVDQQVGVEGPVAQLAAVIGPAECVRELAPGPPAHKDGRGRGDTGCGTLHRYIVGGFYRLLALRRFFLR